MTRVASIVTVLVLCAAPVSAQRPAAGQRPGAARRAAPMVTGSVFGGYDAPLFATDAFATLQPTGQGFSGANASLSYSRQGRRLAFGVNANANTSYYPSFTPKLQPAFGLGATMSSMSQGKWTWDLNGFANYSPVSNTGLFAGANATNGQVFTLASGSAFQVSTLRQADVNTTGSLTYSPTRRTHFQLIGAVGSLVAIDGNIPDNIRLNARARAARDVTRNLLAFAGYSESQNRVQAFQGAPSSSYRLDGIDLGVDFARPIQLTRNTSLGFRTGLVKMPESGSRTFQITGGVTLDHTFQRTWTATLAATRDARFVQSFKDPVVFAGVSASVGGMLFGDLGSVLSANYTNGNINSPNFSSGFLSYSASAQLRYDLRRLVATFVEYSLFRSDIEATSDLAGYPTGAFGRHSIRGGLSFGLNPFRP